MSFNYEIVSNLRITFVKASNTIDLAEILKYLKNQFDDSAYKPGLYSLIDLRDTNVTVSFDDLIAIKKFIGENKRLVFRSKSALIINSNVVFQLAKMLSLLTATYLIDVKIFLGIDEAKRWLGLIKVDENKHCNTDFLQQFLLNELY